jgi:hypothetical protein
MTIDGKHKRQMHDRRSAYLNLEEIEEVINRASIHRDSFREVTIAWTRQCIAEVTNGRFVDASKSFIIHFWKKAG